MISKILAERGCNKVLWECGPKLATSAVKAGCINEIISFIAPKILGGEDNMNPFGNFEFNEMKELLQNALIKINALEQAQKQNLSNSKSNVITKADKLSINTSGGCIKIKSGDQKFAIGGRLMMDYDNMDSGHQTENKSFSSWYLIILLIIPK